MSIFYKLYQNKRKGSVTKDKWYARSAVMGKTVSLEDLAEHMAQHNTPYSEGVLHLLCRYQHRPCRLCQGLHRCRQREERVSPFPHYG